MDALIVLNKTDILLAKERFNNNLTKKAHFAPLTSRESFKALNAEEKRARKAKQFGVQLMPGLGQTAIPSSRHRLNSGKQCVATAKLRDPNTHSIQFCSNEETWYACWL